MHVDQRAILTENYCVHTLHNRSYENPSPPVCELYDSCTMIAMIKDSLKSGCIKNRRLCVAFRSDRFKYLVTTEGSRSGCLLMISHVVTLLEPGLQIFR